MQWTITEHPWPITDKLLIPPGSVIDGVTDKHGHFVGLKWNGQLLPTQSLPQNIVPADEAAAKHLWGSHSHIGIRPVAPLPPPAPTVPAPSIAAVPLAPSPTPPAWSLLTDWAAGSGPGEHVPAGSVLQGVTDKYGKLTGIRWGSATFRPHLPREAMALDQQAADELVRQHWEFPHLLRALPPAVIRAV
jgi:hypothetical protein